VTFKNIGNRTHTVTSDTGLFDSGRMRTGATFEFTFTEPGQYLYFCEPHGDVGGEGMAGVIIVIAGE
jgi:plastocyanin